MAKSVERLRARELRRSGESIREIAKKLDVSKGTVSVWCRDIVLTEDQVATLLSRDVVGGYLGRMKGWETHRREKRQRYAHFHKLGYDLCRSINKNELFLIGLALYWSEGSKRDRRVLLTNSDPALLRIYIRWLQVCLNIRWDELVCRVTINEAHRDRMNDIEEYWSHAVGIPLTQFTKTTTICSKWKKQYENRQAYYGVLAVHVRKSTNLEYQIEGSIDRLRELAALMVQ